MYEIFEGFKAYIDNLSGNKINVLRNYNGKEHANKNLQHLSKENAIQMQHSMPYTPQQNGVVEHKNRALKEMATCMIEDKDLSPTIWDEAINYASYV